MASEGVSWTVYLDGAGEELDRLSKGPDAKTVAAWETALLTGYAVTESRVHVITGILKASGHPASEHDIYSWTGTISFARNPGIFELARGNRPSRFHSMGEHYFFDPGGPDFERGVRQAFWEWVTGGKGGVAPAGGLGPYSGGD
jgi:hypothetical protein